MMTQRTLRVAQLFLLVVVWMPCFAQTNQEVDREAKWYECSPRRTGQKIADVVIDALLINKNLFNWNTLQTFVGAFPVYAVSRYIDEDVHSWFYCREHHKNLHQMDSSIHSVAKVSLAFPVLFSFACALSAWDDDVRQTSKTYLAGLPFVLLMGNAIKELDAGGSGRYRPWNQNFSCKERAKGGFPSGHMASITYTAALYGMRFGIRWGAPLGSLAFLVGVAFVNCNRHLVSQLVAGAGLGVIYACAASKQVDYRLEKQFERNFSMGVCADQAGNPAFALRYQF